MNRKSCNILIYSFLLSLLFLAFCTKSSFLYPYNDWYDANNFLTLGKGLVHGLVPYRDLYEQKGFLLYLLHAVCYIIPGPHFFGVYLLESFAFMFFLFYAGKIIQLYLPTSYVYWILPVISGILLSSESFCQGDSAEELCAPLIMITLFHTLHYFKETYPSVFPYKYLFINGLLAGMIFWIKYTLLGFHFAFMATLFFIMLKDKHLARSIKSCFVFLSGMLLISTPILLYFYSHNSLADLFQVYFYNNIFLYDTEKSSSLVTLLITILLRIGDTFLRNLQFSSFTILGILVFLFSKKYIPSFIGRLMLLVEAVFLSSLIYTGSNFPYYGYILCIFPVLGLIVISSVIELYLPKFSDVFHLSRVTKFLQRYGAFLFISCSLAFAFFRSPNTDFILTPKEQLVQYQFANIINQKEQATLLNYGFLDAGFYTVSNVLPTERFFQMQNISYEAFPEMMDSQNNCIKEQRVDFLIIRGEEVPSWILEYYSIVQKERQLYEGSHIQYILLEKTS